MRQASLYRYTLPLKSGLVLKDIQLSEREGLLVRLSEDGREGWGEIAPLPTFSHESLNEAENAVKIWLRHWLTFSTTVTPLPPSVDFGVSCALAELHGQLPQEIAQVPVPLCSDSSAETCLRLSSTTLAKLKIGRLQPEQDGENAARLLSVLPNLRLRLDANRAWTAQQAVTFAQKLTKSQRARIDFIEEPCHTPESSLAFAKQCEINIAWDETTREPDFVPCQAPYVTALVLKPTLLGSLEKCRTLITQAEKCGLTSVISSSLESSLGLNQLARFATKYTKSPAGLDTLNLMSHQLVRRFENSVLPLLGGESTYVREIQI